MQIAPIKKAPPASSLVAEQLKAAIRDGSLQPGQRLPSELELTKSFQTSRSSVREGIRLLVGLGFLESRPGCGTFVRDTSADDPADAGVRKLAEFCSVHDLMEVRFMLEQHGAVLAAQRADEEDLSAMRDLLVRLEAQTGDADAYFATDAELHRLVARASRNRFLNTLVQILLDEANGPFYDQLRIRRADSFTRNTESMQKLYDALCRRDPRAAGDAMAAHLTGVDADAKESGTL